MVYILGNFIGKIFGKKKKIYNLRNYEGIRFIITNPKEKRLGSLSGSYTLYEFVDNLTELSDIFNYEKKIKSIREYARDNERFINLSKLLDFTTSLIIEIDNHVRIIKYSNYDYYDFNIIALKTMCDIHFCCKMISENRDLLMLCSQKATHSISGIDDIVENIDEVALYLEKILSKLLPINYKCNVTIWNNPELFKI